MKQMVMVMVVGMVFILTGCMTTNANKGATLGALGGMAGSVIGKGDRETTAIIGGAGAVLGYIIGNEIDKANARSVTNTPLTNRRRDCRKVVKRKMVNGKWVETIEEVCESKKIEQGVY